MKMKFVSLMAVLALAAPAVEAETFNFDANHASVLFQIRHLMSKVTGKFNAFEGAVKIDRDDPAASSVTFTIETKSIDTRTSGATMTCARPISSTSPLTRRSPSRAPR